MSASTYTTNEQRGASVFTGIPATDPSIPPADGACLISVIPNEVLINVFEFLGASGIAAVARVCKPWETLTHSPTLWTPLATSAGMTTLSTELAFTKGAVKRVIGTSLKHPEKTLTIGAFDEFKALTQDQKTARLNSIISDDLDEANLQRVIDLLAAGALPNNAQVHTNALSQALFNIPSNGIFLALNPGWPLPSNDDSGNLSNKAILALIEAGALPNNNQDEDNTFNQALEKRASIEVFEALAAVKAMPNNNQDCSNALYVAINNGAPLEIIHILIKAGAKPNNNQDKYNALTKAIERRASREVLEVLIAAGAIPNSEQGYYNTMKSAVRNKATDEVIELLAKAAA